MEGRKLVICAMWITCLMMCVSECFCGSIVVELGTGKEKEFLFK